MWIPNHAVACARRISTHEGRHDEVWWPIEEIEGYLVSDQGRVYSYKRDVILRPSYAPNGRLRVGLIDQGRVKQRYVHRLVADAFLGIVESDGELDGKPVGIRPKTRRDVRHRDGNFDNNRVENLEWCSRSESIRGYLAAPGGHKAPSKRVQVSPIGYIFDSIGECAEHFRVSERTIRRWLDTPKDVNGLKFEEID